MPTLQSHQSFSDLWRRPWANFTTRTSGETWTRHLPQLYGLCVKFVRSLQRCRLPDTDLGSMSGLAICRAEKLLASANASSVTVRPVAHTLSRARTEMRMA